MPTRAELWSCPACGASFTTANQWHSCGQFSLDALFARSEPSVRELFDRIVQAIDRLGSATVIPQRTRVAIQVRMRFAAFMPRKKHLNGHFVLARRRDEPIFESITRYSPRNYVHAFRLESGAQLDETFLDCLREAYRVGEQHRLAGGSAARKK